MKIDWMLVLLIVIELTFVISMSWLVVYTRNVDKEKPVLCPKIEYSLLECLNELQELHRFCIPVVDVPEVKR